jgi:S1-C subfamily serine protease
VQYGLDQQEPWNTLPPPAPPSPPARGRRPLRAVAVVAAVVVVAAAGGGLAGHDLFAPSNTNIAASAAPGSGYQAPSAGGFGDNPGASGRQPASSSPSGNSGTSGSSTETSSIAAHVDTGLVDVNTVIFNGEAEGAGTGMVLTSNGEVLTNNHVVDGATSISVTDIANGKTYSASVVGYDNAKDVAVLALKGASGLSTVTIGNSSAVAPGQQVIAVGNANGAGGTPSYAGGTVVAVNQSISASDDLTGTSEQLTGLIETNADIVPGDSGGPIANSSGAVVGMDTAGSDTFQMGTASSGSDGYAIPINEAVAVAKDIMAGASSATVHVGPTAFLGVEIDPSSSISYGDNGNGGYGGGYGGSGYGGFGGYGSEPTVSGAAISGVVSGGPAAAAGLSPGDVITAVDGHPVTTYSSLTDVMIQEKPGASVKVTYQNATTGQTASTTVTLGTGAAQ